MNYRSNGIIVKTYLTALERAAAALTKPTASPAEEQEKANAAAEIKKTAAALDSGPLKTWANKLVKEMTAV